MIQETKVGILKYVAGTGAKGVKFEDEPDKWYNPTVEAREQVKTEYVGKQVDITLVDGKKTEFTSMKLSDAEICYEEILDEEQLDKKACKEEKVKEKTTLKSKIDKKYIINLQGKEYITHEGLLMMAHSKGLVSIETEIVQNNPEMYIFKATAKDDKGRIFNGFGDANKTNVNSMIAKHMLRMAETRAINRSLRLLTGIGMCSADEMGGD